MEDGHVSLVWIALPIILTSVFSLVVRGLVRRWEGVLLATSGLVSLVFSYFAVPVLIAMQQGEPPAMSDSMVMFGIVNPAFIVGSLTVWRGFFKIF